MLAAAVVVVVVVVAVVAKDLTKWDAHAFTD